MSRATETLPTKLELQQRRNDAEPKRQHPFIKSLKKHWELYLLVLPPVLYLLIFKYIPMVGVQIAFKDFSVVKGIWDSPWVGLKHFEAFFESPNFWLLIKNTIGISFYSLLAGFPIPIMLALALNEIRTGFFKKSVQMVTYAPHFISTVVMVSIIILMLSPHVGVVDRLFSFLGFPMTNFMGIPEYFKSIYVWSGVWQGMGYSSIIYIAALASVDPSLYEAARMDGASRLRKIWHIDIPALVPVTVIMLILSLGSIMGVGFEKIFLMQNPLNTSASEVISTYVYKVGLIGANFSFSSAVGLFNSIINLILLVVVNAISRKVSQNSLW
ncbi:ABC transporter permease subunit [Paenibacillus sp. JJ-223]|uniref:ABC transporter permease n=1 Tax=Paenibacillus sp. JJ-223 TaxID=2905647 RepID=UPI001F2D5A28|nr:ABC transporter permease subunit [Paenibacillus sp. JJ-223]CAH1220024.1 putative multiple-sugar transport system permease YteP [Paenibacillus sp. JJ-223]